MTHALSNVGSSVKGLFVDMKTDFNKIVKKTDKDINVRIKRAVSLAFRTLGVVATAVVGAAFIAGVISVSSLVGAISLIALTTLGLVIAHDLIVVGKNKRVFVELQNPLTNTPKQLIKNMGEAVKMVFKGLSDDVPNSLEGTILFKPVYQLIS